MGRALPPVASSVLRLRVSRFHREYSRDVEIQTCQLQTYAFSGGVGDFLSIRDLLPCRHGGSGSAEHAAERLDETWWRCYLRLSSCAPFRLDAVRKMTNNEFEERCLR